MDKGDYHKRNRSIYLCNVGVDLKKNEVVVTSFCVHYKFYNEG